MSQTLDPTPHSLREAYYLLSTAQAVPDAKLLDDIVRRYPEFGEELTDFAIEIAVDALRGDRRQDHGPAAGHRVGLPHGVGAYRVWTIAAGRGGFGRHPHRLRRGFGTGGGRLDIGPPARPQRGGSKSLRRLRLNPENKLLGAALRVVV